VNESAKSRFGLSKKALGLVRKAVDAERKKPPRIAMIGETGVGKTTTINAMFNAGLQTSHVKACTQESLELSISVTELEGEHGDIRVYDMPGLGEDIESDEKHKETYRRVLTDCDVAVWVLDATTRHFTHTQEALRDLVGVAMGDLDRLVIGINKIDSIRPGTWNEEYNIYSPEQQISIQEKVADVREKIGKVCSIPDSRIVPYSAEKWYALETLFTAMLDACPEDRAWLLYERKDVADYLAKVSPRVVEELRAEEALGD
jgi:predicted GTPase